MTEISVGIPEAIGLLVTVVLIFFRTTSFRSVFEAVGAGIIVELVLRVVQRLF